MTNPQPLTDAMLDIDGKPIDLDEMRQLSNWSTTAEAVRGKVMADTIDALKAEVEQLRCEGHEQCPATKLADAHYAVRAEAEAKLDEVRGLAATMHTDPGFGPSSEIRFTAGWSGATSYYADELKKVLDGS